MAKTLERHRLRTARAGVTMVDLLITLLIIGILTAAAAPQFVDALHRTRADAAAKRVKVDLGYARQTAISQSTTLAVNFTPATNAYSIAGLPDLNQPSQPYAVALDSEPYNAALVSAALGGDGDVQFDRFGKPDSGGTITVQSGGYQQTVTVDAETGRASIP